MKTIYYTRHHQNFHLCPRYDKADPEASASGSFVFKQVLDWRFASGSLYRPEATDEFS
jgi:hypothetical protein